MMGRAGGNNGPVTRILVVDNYDSFVYNLVQYLAQLGAEVVVRRNDEVTPAQALEFDGVLLSPGPGTPEDAGICLAIVGECAGRVPILGVCLGHQCLGQVYGGRIVRARQVMHGKVSKVFHDERGLFAGVANPFVATRYHSLVIEPESMPAELEVTAKTWDDEIMGVRVRALAGTVAPVEGVQFHPESIMTTVGKQLLANFLRAAGGAG